MKIFALVCLVTATIYSSPSWGGEVPAPGERDARIRFVTYKKDEVTEVVVQRGAVTRIALEPDEKIVQAATGFAADCSKEFLEWCVVAGKGDSQVWVKPKDGATANNMELRTDKRDYSFSFKVLEDLKDVGKKKVSSNDGAPMFRVIFRYPVQIPPASALSAMFLAQQTGAGSLLPAPAAAADKAAVEDKLALARPKPRNWSYSVQALQGGQDIVPDLVFDDGRFTYFRFPANREIPTIFMVSPAGEEARVNFHMEGDLVAVQRMGRQFVLRLGSAVVGVWNDDFDKDGLPAIGGTTVDGVVRAIR